MIAVLPLDTRMTQGEMTEAARSSLEEMIRDYAVNLLAASGWTVLTGETTIQILIDNGIDPAKCADQTCHLSIAREINAQKFVSGVVQFAEGEFTASIRLIDTRSGRIVSTERLIGRSTKALREDFAPKAQSFFARGGLTDEVPVVLSDKAKESEGVVKVVSNPPGATVVIDGVVMGRTPYRKPLAAGTYYVGLELEGFQPLSKSVVVTSGEEATVFETLKAERGFINIVSSGFINVQATPDNATITIDGQPASSGQVGPLSAGRHVIRAEAPGYLPRERAVTVQNGETVTATMVLSPIAGSLMVSTNVDADCEAQTSRFRVSPGAAETVTLATGTTRLVCRAPGHEDAVRNVMVESGEVLFVHVTLVPKSRATSQVMVYERQQPRLRPAERYERFEPEEPETSLPPVIDLRTRTPIPVTEMVNVPVRESRALPQNLPSATSGTLEIEVKPRRKTIVIEQPYQAPPAEKKELDVVRTSSRQRCDPASGNCDAKPAARPAGLFRNLVTVDEYARCVQSGACSEPRTGSRCTWGSGRLDQMLNCVDWQQAKQFCEWSGARLPSAEEWQAAAVGERPQLDGRLADPAEFRVRDDEELDDAMSMDALDRDGAFMAKGSRNTLARAAAKPAGINVTPQVWEWTSSSSGSKKVLTGLTRTNSPWPSPSRRSSSTTFSDEALGFRCAR